MTRYIVVILLLLFGGAVADNDSLGRLHWLGLPMCGLGAHLFVRWFGRRDGSHQ